MRLWQDVVRAAEVGGDNSDANRHYNPGCAAARAGTGQGEEGANLSEGEKARWRQQALDWLRADLAQWAKESAKGQKKAELALTLGHWQRDADLAAVREPDLLALPTEERGPWLQLWAEVEDLRAHARKK